MKTKVRSFIPDMEPTFSLAIVAFISWISPKPKACYHAALTAEKAWIWLSTRMSLRGPKSLLVKFIFLPGHVPPPLSCPFPSDLKQRRVIHSITLLIIHVCWWNIESGLQSAVSTQQNSPTYIQAAEYAIDLNPGFRNSRLESQIMSRSELKREWGVSQTMGRLWGAYYI